MDQAPLLSRQHIVLSLLLLALSSAFTLINLGLLPPPLFDETYYIPSAQRYLNGVFYHETHPPLARLLIAAGQAIAYPQEPSNSHILDFKMESDWPENAPALGYRIFPAVFGAAIPVLMYLIGLALFRRPGIAFALALVTLLDNGLLVQSRAAMPDTILLFFFLLYLLVFFVIWQSRDDQPALQASLLWAGLGLALSAAGLVKINMLAFGILVPFGLLKAYRAAGLRRAALSLSVFTLAFVLLFLAVWGIHFALFTHIDPNYTYGISQEYQEIAAGIRPAGPIERFWVGLRDAHQYMFKWHGRIAGLDASNPQRIGSAWYEWPLGGRAIVYRYQGGGPGGANFLIFAGNPVVWLCSLIGVIGTAAAVLHPGRAPLLGNRFGAAAALLAAYLAYMGPMMLIPREMYLYHYLPAMLLGLVGFFLLLDALGDLLKISYRTLAVLLVGMAYAAYSFLSPFTYYARMDRAGFEARNIWPAWQIHWPE